MPAKVRGCRALRCGACELRPAAVLRSRLHGGRGRGNARRVSRRMPQRCQTKCRCAKRMRPPVQEPDVTVVRRVCHMATRPKEAGRHLALRGLRVEHSRTLLRRMRLRPRYRLRFIPPSAIRCKSTRVLISRVVHAKHAVHQSVFSYEKRLAQFVCLSRHAHDADTHTMPTRTRRRHAQDADTHMMLTSAFTINSMMPLLMCVKVHHRSQSFRWQTAQSANVNPGIR